LARDGYLVEALFIYLFFDLSSKIENDAIFKSSHFIGIGETDIQTKSGQPLIVFMSDLQNFEISELVSFSSFCFIKL